MEANKTKNKTKDKIKLINPVRHYLVAKKRHMNFKQLLLNGRP